MPASSDRSVPIDAQRDSDALARALEVTESARYDAAALRVAVRRFVSDAKHHGTPPEGVLVALKERVRSSRAWSLHQDERESLLRRLVNWAIDEYYRGR